MNQKKYPPISTIKISTKGEFHWVKCPSSIDPHRSCLLQSYATNSAAHLLESAQWEINKLLPLSHPDLQSVVDVFAAENSLHVVQELEQWECAITKVPYTPVQAKHLLQEITPVLIYLHHQGIIHGNISPETIVVNELDRHILTNFLVIVDLISQAGGDTYPRLRSQLEQIPVVNIPTGQEWDLYSLGVTTIALLTNRDYQYLYDPISKKWEWESHVDCSEELTRAINRLLGQEKPSLNGKVNSTETAIVPLDRQDRADRFADLSRTSILTKKSNRYRIVIGLLLFGIVGLLGYLIWDKFHNKFTDVNSSNSQLQPFPQNGTLTVGYINRTPSRPQSQKRDYPQFKSYLETELRKKYGNNLKIELDSVLTTREAQDRIKQKKWDVAFTASATNAIVAEDHQYEFIARMSAQEDPYRDVCFFVKKGSKIKSGKDFRSSQTIALPNEDSPTFTMPLHDLYGKKMRVNLGNTLGKIQEKVKSGEADVGVDFCKMVAKSPQLRSLSPNRIIPVGGVFLSPKIAQSVDRDYITESIIKAPDDVQSMANYTRSSGINYTQFRRINDRANQLLNCIDLTRNPVEFYCPKPPEK
jgi:serine/threonine protein kinase